MFWLTIAPRVVRSDVDDRRVACAERQLCRFDDEARDRGVGVRRRRLLGGKPGAEKDERGESRDESCHEAGPGKA
jgi:hypothetical protein